MERRTLYITSPGARLQRADGLLAVSLEGAVVERCPVEQLDRVLLFGGAQLTTQAIALLLSAGVPVLFFSSAGGYRGQLVGPETGNVFLRLAQHARHRDPEFRLRFSKDLVCGKLRAGRALLRRHARNHPERAPALEAAARRISEALDGAEPAPGDDVLRGVEGSAAAAYFHGFDQMVRPPFRFERRSQHPARNEVNALLNLGYTLLCGEVASRLEAAGFDPRIGYYHGVRYGRMSLALDLLEAHRVDVIDRLTLSLLNRRMVAPEDFVDRGGAAGVRLRPAALQRYLALYEAALGDVTAAGECPRARIQAQVSALRHAVLGTGGP